MTRRNEFYILPTEDFEQGKTISQINTLLSKHGVSYLNVKEYEQILIELYHQCFEVMTYDLRLYWNNINTYYPDYNNIYIISRIDSTIFRKEFNELFKNIAYFTWNILYSYGLFEKKADILFDEMGKNFLKVRLVYEI